MNERQFIRLFIGIPLQETERKVIAETSRMLGREIQDVRWVPRENLHVTLKFLGRCDISIVPEICNAIEGAKRLLPIFTEIGGIGGFPSLASAKVIWVGVERDVRLLELFSEMEGRLKAIGFEKEKRSFSPHITIGRSKKGVNILQSIENLLPRRSLQFKIEEIALFESVLKRSGAEYTILHSVRP